MNNIDIYYFICIIIGLLIAYLLKIKNVSKKINSLFYSFVFIFLLIIIGTVGYAYLRFS